MAIVGRVLIFIAQQFPLPEKIEKIKFISKLHECDLCLGVWVFTFLAWMMKVDLLSLLGFPKYVPFVSELVTGSVTSFTVHLLRLGWNSRFDIIEL